ADSPMCADSYSVMLCFFFFQAEDGIRYWSVTGVQTCALPISPSQPLEIELRLLRDLHEHAGVELDLERLARRTVGHERPRDHVRSEERRVGKEGRARWGPYH